MTCVMLHAEKGNEELCIGYFVASNMTIKLQEGAAAAFPVHCTFLVPYTERVPFESRRVHVWYAYTDWDLLRSSITCSA